MRAGVWNDAIAFDIWDEDYYTWSLDTLRLVDEEVIFYDRLNESWWFRGEDGPEPLEPLDIILFNSAMDYRLLRREYFDENFYVGKGEYKMLAVARGDTIEYERWLGPEEKNYADWLYEAIEDGIIHEYYQTWMLEDYALDPSGCCIILYSYGELRVMDQKEFSKLFMEVV